MALVDIGSLSAVPDPGSPEAARDRLLKALDVRAADVALLERYYDGNHPLPEPPQRMQQFVDARRAFEQLSRFGVTNYVPPTADTKAERLRVVGFRFGEVENLDADPVAWRIWQRNHLDADSGLVHHDALVTGTSFALVWPDAGLAEITIEHPGQTIVAYRPGSRRARAAGLKSWCEDDGSRRVVLYLPESVYKWQSDTAQSQLKAWQPKTDDTWPITNPLGRVPLVEFRARPSSRPSPFGGGRSEFASVLPIQDRINKTVFDRLVTAEFQAFRQRYAVGWSPDDPNEAVKASVSHMLTFKDEGVTLGEFSQADFSPFMAAVSADVEAIGAITSTPFYALGKLANPPSGDALMALQSGLISKTEEHRDNFGESWEEVLRLALAAENDPRAADQQSTVLWRSVVHVTWAEKADAAVKLKAIGVPDEEVWTMLDYTPQDIERFLIMKADQSLFGPQVTVAGQ